VSPPPASHTTPVVLSLKLAAFRRMGGFPEFPAPRRRVQFRANSDISVMQLFTHSILHVQQLSGLFLQ